MSLDPNENYRIIVWFRNDLRLHDNPILDWAERQLRAVENGNMEIVPVFVFDERFYTKQVEEKYGAGSRKAGILRTKFHLETVKDLRQSLNKIGSELLVSYGDTANAISNLMQKNKKTAVVYTRAVTSEELEVEHQVKQRLGKDSVIVPLWSASIKHIDDIPFEWGGIKRISNTWF